MRIFLSISILIAACLCTACGPSRAELAFSAPALGERLSPGTDLIFPARLRSAEGVDGRLVVTAKDLIFDAGTSEASRRWELHSIRALKRNSENLIVVEPYENSGYIFEVPGPGLADRDYRIMLGRLALARNLR
jgi:hypothetical protein